MFEETFSNVTLFQEKLLSEDFIVHNFIVQECNIKMGGEFLAVKGSLDICLVGHLSHGQTLLHQKFVDLILCGYFLMVCRYFKETLVHVLERI